MKSRFAQIFFSLFFLKKFLVDFFEIILSNLNDIFINSLDDLLFRDDAFEVVDRVDWDVRDVWVKISFVDENLNCSYSLLRSSSHFAKSMTFRVTVRIAMLKNFWFSVQSVKTRFFSLIRSKNRIIFRRSWWLAEDSLIIAEKFELLFTNWKRRWACRMMWSLRDECFEVRLINRGIFTQNRLS
jgi:hypothetical protein